MSNRYTLADLYNDIVVGIPSGATEYLYNRIQRINYRGIHLSQHNRYTKDIIITILKELENILQNENLKTLQIRTTDLSKRQTNTPDEYHYAILTNNIASRIGRITQDSLRKNFFVDMARMGLINRFDPKMMLNDPHSRSQTKFINITEAGYSFLNEIRASNVFNINRLWTDALTNLHNGFENTLYAFMLELSNKGIDSISYDEFALFVSDLINFPSHEILNYFIEFRNLAFTQRKHIIDSIKKYANPKDNEIFIGLDKTQVRDYHNWINEAQQLFMILDESVLFGVGDFRKNELNIRTGDIGLISNNDTRLKRSTKQKNEYYINHGIDRQIMKGQGFELHHIVPLACARNQNEFSVLDTWENMILIDGHNHAKISQNGSKNIKLDFIGDDIEFSDFKNPPNIVKCIYDTHIKYNINLKDTMKSTNTNILNSL